MALSHFCESYKSNSNHEEQEEDVYKKTVD